MEQNEKKFSFSESDLFLPGISLDCVIFSFHDGNLKILLNRFRDYSKWMLPGGFVHKEESVDEAAARTLTSRTGIRDIYLRQFYLFGDRDRINIEENRALLLFKAEAEMEQISSIGEEWFLQRFVSVGYFAFVEFDKIHISTNPQEETQWFDLHEVPVLYADHNKIIEKAITTIRGQLNSIPIGYELLPEKFTLTQLRIIYETILDKKLDRRNFQRKILSTGLVYKRDEVYKKMGL
ncbi:MAG: NUDIX domain-containing protein [Tannerellaceae bacterium]|nr:NUDIX domain-containing protein [Tannerellaceae bacterium]